MTNEIEKRKRAIETLLMAARQLYNNSDLFGSHFTSTVIMPNYLCWMNESQSGYFKINIDSGEVIEVNTVEDVTGKFVDVHTIRAIARAITNFILMCLNMIGYNVSLPQLSHQVLDGIGYKVTTPGANETDFTLWASHDYFLELAQRYASSEMNTRKSPDAFYSLSTGQTLKAIYGPGSEVVFGVYDSDFMLVQTGILEMRNALREMANSQQS